MNTLTHSDPPPTLEEIWRLFRETDRKFQETDRQFKETDRKFQETDRQFKETDRKFQETDRQFKKTDDKLNKLEKLFTSQWGKLVESLVEGALVRIFNERGIPIQYTYTRVKGTHEGKQWEIDIVAKNGDAVIMVEVKTTLRPDDVKEFLEDLAQVKTWMREYSGNNVYGAVAYLSADAEAERMAQNRGLFVIKATGDSAYLENPPDFVPQAY